MSKKIVGMTVGTPLSPTGLEKKLKPVKTVNGVAPDESGNVAIPSGPTKVSQLENDAGYAKKDELPKLYEVTITDNGDGTYTSDHYYADIKAAYESGRIPIAVMGTSRYQLTTLPKFASLGAFFGEQNASEHTSIKITGNAVKVSTTTFVTPDDIPDFPNTDPFYLLINTVADEDGYFPIVGWMDGSTPTLETDLTACCNAYMQGRAVFARFEGGGEKPVELPIPCTYCNEEMAIFTLNLYGMTMELFASDGIAALISFTIGNCTVSVTGNDADGYTADKSYDELMVAYEFGQTLVCEYEGVRLPFVTINEDMFQFSISMGGCMTMMVLVGDGFASVGFMEGTITINNVEWCGDEPMDFTDTINAMIDAKLAEIPNASGVSF